MKRILRGDCGKASVGLFNMKLKHGWFTHEIAQTLEFFLPLIFGKWTPILFGSSAQLKYLISQAYLQIYTGTASKIQVNIPGKAVHPLIKDKCLRGEDCMWASSLPFFLPGERRWVGGAAGSWLWEEKPHAQRESRKLDCSKVLQDFLENITGLRTSWLPVIWQKIFKKVIQLGKPT